MHVLLASDSSDPSFAAEEPSAESLALVAATLDEEIEAVFAHLPESEVLAPIAGRGEEVRERLRVLASMTSRSRVIRIHGNLHLGDLLWTGSDWLVLDFEGPPERSVPERRRKRSPLRDVAEHAALVRLRRLRGGARRRQRRRPTGWEEQARENFLRGYFSVAESSGVRARRCGRRRAAARDLRAREGGRRVAPRARGAARTGSRSPSPRSSVCSRSRSRSSVGAWQCHGIFGIVLAGGEGKRLLPLTLDRAKPAVPFGGNYRLVDFALSNLVNAGYLKIAVLTQYKSHSLDRHITTTWRLSPLLGNYVTPVPAQQRRGPHWFAGSADAIYQSLNLIYDERPEYVCVFGADHIYRMDPGADGRRSTSRPAPASRSPRCTCRWPRRAAPA